MTHRQPGEPIAIDAGIVANALVMARVRIVEPDEFRREELAWLQEHSPLGHLAITEMFGFEMAKRDHGPTVAMPAMQGALCGSYVVRRLAEEGQADYEEVVANHVANFGDGKKLRYARELTPEELDDIFGNEAGGVLATIMHPIARTMCGVIILTSLSRDEPDAGSQTFLKRDAAKRPRPHKRTAGSAG